MANNNYKVISARELLPHEKRLVEDDFSRLGPQDLDRLAPSALSGQKLMQGLVQGDYLLLSDAPVRPRYPANHQSRPRGNHFSGHPAPNIAQTYTPEPLFPNPPKNKPLQYQYCVELNCSPETFQRYRGGGFVLAKTDCEVARSVDVKEILSNGYHRCHIFCSDSEAKTLQQSAGGGPYPFYKVSDVAVDPKGSAQVREAFLLVTPMVQWEERLGYATRGYYYQFRDTRLLAEYKLSGNGMPHFQPTLSGAGRLSDTVSGRATSAIMLYWREHEQVVKKQYLVYRQEKLTAEELAGVDEGWLSAHGVEIDVEQALAAVESGVQGGKEISGRYHHLQSVQYDYGEAFLAGSPAILANRRREESDNIQLPVINVANLTPEPQWIELEAMPFGRYKINLAQPEYMQNPNGSYPAVVPRYPPIYGELDGSGLAYVELPPEWRDKEVDIFIEAPGESGWLVFWHNASSLLQIGSGVLMIVAATGVSATGVGTVIGLGLAAMGADQISAGTQSIWTQQQVKTLGAQGLEFIGVDEQYSELIYSVVPLGGAVLREGTRMALNSTMVRNVQVIAAKSGEQAIKQIRLFGVKIRQRVTLNGHQVGAKGTTTNTLRQTGAREFNSVAAYELAEAEALEFYKAVRISNSSDVVSIAKNTGWPQYRIERVKNHLFIDNTHILRDGKVGRFSPDFEISDAWKRLQTGSYKPSDINLLKHEYFESRFERLYRTDYMTAHEKTILSGRDWKP